MLDTQAVAAPDEEAQPDASALCDAHPVEVGEAAVERDAAALAEADPQLVVSGVAAALAVTGALLLGATDGEAHVDGEVLCDGLGEALGVTGPEREPNGLCDGDGHADAWALREGGAEEVGVATDEREGECDALPPPLAVDAPEPLAPAEPLGHCDGVGVGCPGADAVGVAALLEVRGAEGDSGVPEPLRLAPLRDAPAVTLDSAEADTEAASLKEERGEGEPAPLAVGGALGDKLFALEGEASEEGEPPPDALPLPLAEPAALVLGLLKSDLDAPLGDPAGEIVAQPEPEGDTVEEAEAHAVREAAALPVSSAERAPLALPDAELLAQREREGDAELQPEVEKTTLPVTKVEPLGLATSDSEGGEDAVPVTHAAALAEAQRVAEPQGDAVADKEGNVVAVGGNEPPAEALPLGEGAGDAEAPSSEAVAAADAEGEEEEDGEGAMLPDGAAEEVVDAEGAREMDAASEREGVGEGPRLGVPQPALAEETKDAL